MIQSFYIILSSRYPEIIDANNTISDLLGRYHAKGKLLKLRWPKRTCLLNSEIADPQRVMVPFENVMKAILPIFTCTYYSTYTLKGFSVFRLRIPVLSKGERR